MILIYSGHTYIHMYVCMYAVYGDDVWQANAVTIVVALSLDSTGVFLPSLLAYPQRGYDVMMKTHAF